MTVPLPPDAVPDPVFDPGPDAAPDRAGAAAHRAKGATRPPGSLWRVNPREQGLLGLTDAIAWFGRRGWSVSLPLIDSQSYDLVVDDGDALHRVQVKTTTYRSPYGVFVVRIDTRGGNQSYHTAKPFDPQAVDLLYVLTDGGDRYLLPTSRIRGTSTLNLGRAVSAYRISPG